MASFANTSESKQYDCVIVGAGVSGLRVAKDLIAKYGVSRDNILVLEAMDYVGGRIRQATDFIKGVKVELGAEILHGKDTPLTAFAKEYGEKIEPIYVWAHGDGGPLPTPVNGCFGLYYVGKGNGEGTLLRYDDDQEGEFQRLNETLWAIELMDIDTLDENTTMLEYLRDEKNFQPDMIGIANAGYANTLCCNIEQLSFKQSARWNGFWHEESEEDGDFKFTNSYSCLIDHLKRGVRIKTNTPVTKVDILEGGEQKSVKVTTKEGVEYHAKSAVIAVPPFVFRSDYITFNPILPDGKFAALDYTYMMSACKVFVKFSKVCFPKNVQGMIMYDPEFIFPEVWFRDVTDLINPEEEEAVCYATGFCTSNFADRILAMPEEEVYASLCKQLDTVFSKLEARHFTVEGDLSEKPYLPKPSEVYLGGRIQAWDPKSKPFIGGGYSAPKAGYPTNANDLLGEPVNDVLFFAGEATNVGPAGTAHAALAAGERCSGQVADYLKNQTK
jgi:protoporphyrinogen oxidase